MPQIDVTISIVSYNSREVIVNCLQSVIETTRDLAAEIIVVDNASADGTASVVKSAFPDVRLLENRHNPGFGTAHNQAFKVSRGRYFLILNPDTIVFPDAIRTMAQFMDENRRAGVAGCKTFWDDEKIFMFPDLKIHDLQTVLIHFTPFCLFFPASRLARRYWQSAYHVWDARAPVEVEGVTGGLMLVRREAFESVGGFDEKFFLFFEEHDLLRRIKQAGWGVSYLPGAAIQHFYEESIRNSAIDIGAVYLQSACYYYRKNFGAAGYLFLRSLLLLERLVRPLALQFLEKNRYEEVVPSGPRLAVRWQPLKNAARYLAEISYSPYFNDRGGLYVRGESLSLSSGILERLPGHTGYIRILPVFEDRSVGRPLKTVKITGRGPQDS